MHGEFTFSKFNIFYGQEIRINSPKFVKFVPITIGTKNQHYSESVGTESRRGYWPFQ